MYNFELNDEQIQSIITKLSSSMKEDILHIEIDDDKDISYEIESIEGKNKVYYEVEISFDSAIILYRNNNTITLSDEQYNLLKDVFIPLRNRLYEIADNAEPELDDDIDFESIVEDNFDFSDIHDCSNPDYYEIIGLNFA